MIELPAIPTPHQGTSYNPPVEDHRDLLRAAHAVEEEGMKGADEGRDVHERMTRARQLGDVTQEGLPPGMALHEVEEEEEEEAVVPLVKPAPARKTKQQRKKAQRVLDEVRFLQKLPELGSVTHPLMHHTQKRALADRAAKRKLLASVFTAKALRKSLEHSTASRERLREERRRMVREKLKQGLAGQRFGKHTVQKVKIDVQLGEDLTDSLRGLKVSLWCYLSSTSGGLT